MFRLFLIGLILHPVIGILQSNDCYILSLICKEDPNCFDDAVFYSKCVHYGKSQDHLPDVIAESMTWADRDNPRQQVYSGNAYENYVDDHRDKKLQQLRDLYSDYQRESIRESLVILKKQLNEKRDSTKSLDIDINKPTEKDILFADNNTSISKDIGTHQKTSDSDSIDQSVEVTDQSGDAENAENHDTDLKKTTLDVKHIDESQHEETRDLFNDSTKEKKSNIINKAFDYVRSMINERDDSIIVPIESADVVPEKVKRKVLPNDSAGSDIPVSTTHDHSNLVKPGMDRSEVALPIYTRSDNSAEQDKKAKKNLGIEEDRGLLILKTSSDSLSDENAVQVGKVVQQLLWNITKPIVLHFQSVVDESNAVYRMKINTSWFKFNDNALLVAKRINLDDAIRDKLNKKSGVIILSAESTTEDTYAESHVRDKERKSWDQLTLFSAVIAASVLGLLFAAIIVCIIKKKGRSLTPLIFKRQEAVQDYQELCRTQMSVANSPRPEDETDKNGTMKTWNDEQSPYNMDITTGHVILAYMEDHLKNENRLNKEWEALCSYKADECETQAGSDIKHTTKNRYRDVLPYDHTRVKLRQSSNAFHSDYINASFITDTDPKNPSYIATQGPLDNTVADFWQMVWEQGVVVIINLTKLSDMGLPQCHHYWPLDGSEVYHIYEVHLISEHIWCDDYLVRSLYLKNLQTAETRTVTQFHYLTWPDLSIPSSPKPLLEFRRKVNKCYRGHACPVVVHCNNGVGRTGTYILLDMVLNKMVKGTKEIDIAATLEHLREQRQDFVKTKGQFEFALLAVAEEVTAILSSVAR